MDKIENFPVQHRLTAPLAPKIHPQLGQMPVSEKLKLPLQTRRKTIWAAAECLEQGEAYKLQANQHYRVN